MTTPNDSKTTHAPSTSSQTTTDLPVKITKKDEQIATLKLQNNQLANEYSILNARLIQLEQMISNVSNQ